MNTRFSLRAMITTITLIAVLLAGYAWSSRGVTVTVFNDGDSPLKNLTVHVTGKAYDLGDIASDSIKKCTVNVTGESHVEISYKLVDGTEHRHAIDCYFEPGNRGSVDVRVRESDLIHSKK